MYIILKNNYKFSVNRDDLIDLTFIGCHQFKNMKNSSFYKIKI